ncbi:hypothetical protein CPC08DRAFT_731702, partial [Agrocybe pediades]
HYGLVPTTSSDVESNSRTRAPSAAISGSGNDLDPIQLHYCTAYSAAELKTFHCERDRKMPLSGLDPSMLIGFLVRDEKDWRHFRRRVGETWMESLYFLVWFSITFERASACGTKIGWYVRSF